MKHLRIVNLLIVLLLLAGWAPPPQTFSSGSPVVALAWSGSFTLVAPASGVKVTTWPEFKWKFTGTNPDKFTLQISRSYTFRPLLTEFDMGLPAPVSGVYAYTPVTNYFPNSVLYWRVVAHQGNAAISSGYRSLATYPEPVASLISPVGGVTVDTLRPELTWSAPSAPENVTTWNVQLALNDLFTLGLKSYLGVKQNRLEVPANLMLNTVYFWRVQSVAKNGLKSPLTGAAAWTGPATFRTPATPPPPVPILVYPANLSGVTSYTPEFRWNGVASDANVRYNLQISTNALFTPPLFYQKLGIEQPLLNPKKFTLDTPLSSNLYYWRVQAYFVDTGVKSGWTKPFVLKAPSQLTVRLYDLATGLPLAGEQVWVTSSSTCKKDGIYTKYVQASGLTDPNGVVTLNGITAGTRYVCATPLTYTPVKKAYAIAAGKVYDYQASSLYRIAVTKPVITITLFWSTIPSDLDVHLWLPAAFQGDSYAGHIYPDGQRGLTTAYPWAKISGDAFGIGTSKTEVVTIQTRFPGTYIFAVRNKSTEDWFATGKTLPRVSVKYNNVPVNFVHPGNTAECSASATKANCWLQVPAKNGGRWWNVLTIDGATGVITADSKLLTDSDAMLYFPYDPMGGVSTIK